MKEIKTLIVLSSGYIFEAYDTFNKVKAKLESWDERSEFEGNYLMRWDMYQAKVRVKTKEVLNYVDLGRAKLIQPPTTIPEEVQAIIDQETTKNALDTANKDDWELMKTDQTDPEEDQTEQP